MKCEICNKTDFHNKLSFTMHIVRFHKLSAKEYYDTYLKTDTDGFCQVCHKETHFNNIFTGYLKCCSNSCSQKLPETQQKIMETKLRLYGSATYNNRKKAIQTSNEKYGKGNYNNRQKAYKTHKERYGVEHPLQYKEFNNNAINTRLNTYGEIITPDMIAKAKNTRKEKYGDENYVNIEKCKHTKFLKYGDENYANVEKMKQTKLTKNNGHYFTNDIIQKSNESKLRRYGRMHITYKYFYKEKYFDSSWELAYYIWLTDNKIDFEYQPKIIYSYEFGGKLHHYEPDFSINGQLVELKNTYLMKRLLCEGTQDNAKYQCMLKNNVKIITDIKDVLKYIQIKYGKDYLKSFKINNKTV